MPIVTAATQLLARRYGAPVVFTDVECISEEERRNRLLRCTLGNSSPGLPATLIIKQVVAKAYNPDDVAAWDTRRFFQDWAGAEFLSSLPGHPGHGPHFYGGDRTLGFFVLEDLGRQQRSLVEPLLEGDAATAEGALLRYVTRLGNLHADTVGKAADFEAVLYGANPALRSATTAHQAELRQYVEEFARLLTSLGVHTETHLQAELHGVIDAIEQPGPFAAYIHADPCPDNMFYIGDDVRLIDFEFGRFGHALVDAAYGRIIFPTCWCCNRIPTNVLVKLEAAYRSALATGCAAAADDHLFTQALAQVCAFWLLQSCSWLLPGALQEDHTWGIASVRSRILARLEAFITTASDFDQLPATRMAANHLLEVLQERWPATEPLPLYPAFRKPTPSNRQTK
jgi:hypothetical protein